MQVTSKLTLTAVQPIKVESQMNDSNAVNKTESFEKETHLISATTVNKVATDGHEPASLTSSLSPVTTDAATTGISQITDVGATPR